MHFRTIAIVFISSLIMISCAGDDYYNLGVFEAKNGNYEKSIYYFSKAIEKNPNDAEAYYSRAYSQQMVGGKYRNIISDYSKSLELHPNDYEAYMNRGAAYIKIRQYTEAISDYKESISIKPDYSQVYENLGDAYLLTNKTEMACANWKQSVKLGNKKAEVKVKLNCE